MRIRSCSSISKRSGLANLFVAGKTRCALPSPFVATTPQHSFGASARACATIWSYSSRAMRIRVGLRDLALARGGEILLGLILVLGDAGDRVLELAHALADRAAGLREALGAEHQQGDHEDQDDLHRSDLRK